MVLNNKSTPIAVLREPIDSLFMAIQKGSDVPTDAKKLLLSAADSTRLESNDYKKIIDIVFYFHREPAVDIDAHAEMELDLLTTRIFWKLLSNYKLKELMSTDEELDRDWETKKQYQ